MPEQKRRMTPARFSKLKYCHKEVDFGIAEVERKIRNDSYCPNDYGKLMVKAMGLLAENRLGFGRYFFPLGKKIIASASNPKHDPEKVADLLDLLEIIKKGEYKESSKRCQRLVGTFEAEKHMRQLQLPLFQGTAV